MKKHGLISILLALMVGVSYSQVVDKSQQAFRSFWHPMYLGERLDYCAADGKTCGKPIAQKYCRMMGYEDVHQQVIAYNIGLTHIINSHALCKGWRCKGFMTVECAKSMAHHPASSYHYREKQFAYPRYQDYRLDWCRTQHKSCGAKAAFSFCSQMGYMHAKHFEKETQLTATKTIGSEELCFGPECQGFKTITCAR